MWQFGGGNITGTIHDFGGNPTAAWGNTFESLFQTGPATAQKFITDFRHEFDENPCPVGLDNFVEKVAKITRR
jgi:hypothetical protein